MEVQSREIFVEKNSINKNTPMGSMKCMICYRVNFNLYQWDLNILSYLDQESSMS